MNGKVAVVTGAGSGIGRRVAERFAAAGASVLLTDRDEEGLREATAALADRRQGAALAHAGDISLAATSEEIFGLAESSFGPVDILANVAGMSIRRSLGQTTIEDWDRTLAVNLTGPFLTCRRAAESMAGRGGAIVNVSAVAGLIGMGTPAYCAAKAGLIGLTRILATELAPDIRVNAVAPGPTATALNADVRADPLVERQIAATTLARRWADAEEIAATVFFLASEEASYVTGQVLVADGGMTATINVGTAYQPEN